MCSSVPVKFRRGWDTYVGESLELYRELARLEAEERERQIREQEREEAAAKAGSAALALVVSAGTELATPPVIAVLGAAAYGRAQEAADPELPLAA